ncbi:MAG: DUF1553 domain-containing protein [Planctomycetaceae bacterium]|nr:DUF1553 domain-containing protein [Planctomycetaceae bacterium]
MRCLVAVIVFTVVICSAAAGDEERVTRLKAYAEMIREDGPIAHWHFSESHGTECVANSIDGTNLVGHLEGNATLGNAGPTPKEYPLFDDENRSLTISGAKNLVRVPDPGENSVLDFANGETITIEAWVNPSAVSNDQQAYILGKGRTQNKGYASDNQNYALRLRGMNGTARVSFLFRKAATEGRPQAFHRWNSDVGFVVDGTWHHVAVVYEFGQPEKIRAYVDGQVSQGSWDMGGPTTDPPVVDNDDVWIGTSMGGNIGSTLVGRIDEVAIYRKAVDDQRLRDRYQAITPDPVEAEFASAVDLPRGSIVTQLFEKLPPGTAWTLNKRESTFEYAQPSFAFVGYPKKYNSTGVIDDRSNPFLLRARARRVVLANEAGEYQILVRSKNAARFYIDGKLVAQTGETSRNASGHEEVPESVASDRSDLRELPPGCQEQFATVELTEGEHILRLDAIVGGSGLRLELDELCVAIAKPGEPFALLSADGAAPVSLTEEAWSAHRDELRDLLATIDRENRELASQQWKQYWDRRHDAAREAIEQTPGPVPAGITSDIAVYNEVDRFIAERLTQEGVATSELTDDYAFLRRVTLDTVGIVPSRSEVANFLSDKSPDRRSRVIDRLLDDPRWADHWVGYWQDVLAENPGILKPKLNNTGPFRWWIYESFLDNKPMDRFVTELVLMEGSTYYGGPAGFAMATQNDVPFAAKAHVLGKAFLAMDMTCARCHDAPYHPFKQQELFSLAAMLERKTITLPKTSTVPVSEGARKPLVEITLKPGTKIDPTWPFASLEIDPDSLEYFRQVGDTREQLAAAITSSHDNRFAKVLVNRLWRRYLGRGLIEPVDDWETDQEASHPKLLEYLSRQLIVSGYDLQHVARLIFNSHTYQRQVATDSDVDADLFASPTRRRMSAEQLVDSLFAASGKQMRAESLTLDPEGRRPVDSFLNLGDPNRAWQFTSLSNERDRPALALPMSQSVIDLLLAYGWRDSRPNPLTVREQSPTVLQPLTLANGVIGARAVRLSDDNAITGFCLDDSTPETLVEAVSLQILSRPPTATEQSMFVDMIRDGFESRVLNATHQPERKKQRNTVSWSNHLSAEATRIKLEMEREVQAGDPPTPGLAADWRERMEDVVWAMFNSPEFIFIP